MQAPKPENEKERIAAIEELHILDTPINPVFERITRITKQMFGVPIVAISIIDSERQWFKSTQGLNVCENGLEASFCAHAILQDDIFVVPDVMLDKRFIDNPLVSDSPYIRFYAGCPVRTADGYKVGTLCIIDKQTRKFSAEELAGLRDMAALVQDELQKYREKYSQLKIIQELDKAKRAKLIDGLTGVWNREGTEINIRENIILAKNQKNEFVLGILDIDNFKKVNDTYGHNAGDEVIREVCKRMVVNLDDHDIMGRWGGEEFIILVFAKTTAEAIQRIEKARASVAAEPVVFENAAINVTVTIGLTIYNPNHAVTMPEIVAKADGALYEGKNSGKNKYVIH